ncbi:acyl-CoA dehydrogenase family protein [Comamonas endophytica]|uniref:Acyl-CoA dehydrogenase family protein n=2 Tax=Comamonas endophytica TaxID=2949090 RepID=A0ABY6GDH7_9BURK|nr:MULTISPECIES: acyl-CoA dehydrogenase family protein [unclassified Acidovorax]MCD2512488.1 DNA alkylation response protein [Acidovorax sp. D4N7]UYG53144.1 acyl-CoA dehydrogenase family protein [Acidovorax sp. 5MLIR]
MSTVLQPAKSSITYDAPLEDALRRANLGSVQDELDAYADRLARAQPPAAAAHDHPAWQAQRALGRRQGLVSQALTEDTPGRWSVWAAGLYLHSQFAPDSVDPLLLTSASLAVLRKESALWARLGPPLRNPEDDPRDLPIGEKSALWMGLDASAVQPTQPLRAVPPQLQAMPVGMGAWGRQYLLSGSSPGLATPDSDAHLLCAQTAQGPSCFFVPRWREDGQRNGVVVQPQPNALGTHIAAELQLDAASGYLLGEEGQGQASLHTAQSVVRLGHTLASCALLRQALVQSLAQARRLTQLQGQPLLGSVLVDMAIESEAALVLAMRLAQAYERCDDSDDDTLPVIDRAFQQVMAPAAQFWIGRRAMEITAETMEWAGSQGALESPQGRALARLFLAAPAQGRGEGMGNALCLQALHALDRQRPVTKLLFEALESIARSDARILAHLHALRAMLAQPPAEQQAMARMLVQRLVLTVQACLLHRDAPPAVSQAFITTRLGHAGAGRVLGALDTRQMNVDLLLKRALPE